MRILITSFKLLQFIKFNLTLNNSESVAIGILATLGAVAVLCLLVFVAVGFLVPNTMLHINIHLEWVISSTGPCFALLMAGVVALLRLYKKTIHNVIDFVIFLLVFLISAFNFFYFVL